EIDDIYQDPKGDVWIRTNSGLNRFHNGTFRLYTTKDGLPDNRITAIARSYSPGLWVQTPAGLARWEGERFTTPDAATSIGPARRAMLRDRAGAFWLGGLTDRGLLRVRHGQVTYFSKREGLADDSVVALFEDRAGSVWVGTLQGGVTRISSQDRLTTWSTRDGLANNHVKAFFEDDDGALWIGTHGGGLSRLKNGRLATISSRQGLYNDIIFAIVNDDEGNLWMNCNRGIWRTSLQELNDVADGRRATVTSFAYGVADGMLS